MITRPQSADPLACVRDQLARGALADAEATCRQALEANPDDARAGRLEEALASARRSLGMRPDFAPALMEQAAAAKALARWVEARGAIEALLAISPDRAELYYDLATVLAELGNTAGAGKEIEHALRLNPRLCDAWLLRGALAVRGRRPDDAVASFERAVALDPREPRALEGLANAHRDARKSYAAWIAARRRVCEARPDSSEAWCRLGYAFRTGDLLADARDAYRQALAVDPECLPARWALFQLPDSLVYASEAEQRSYLERWGDGLAEFDARLDATPASAAQAESCLALATNFHVHYLYGADPEPQRRHALVVQRLARVLAPELEPAPPAAAGARRRVGFVSAFFRRHTVGKLFAELVARLDRSRFETIVFHCDDARDALSEDLAARVDRYLHGEHSISRWIATLRDNPVDVLVFVDVGMHPTTQALAAVRYAPVQCALWGHPVTTGFDTIDYFLSSEWLEADDAERHYTEQLVRLPGLGAWYAGPSEPAGVSPAVGWPADAFRILLPASIYKLSPRHDVLLARIAEAVPEATVLLLPHRRAHVCDALKQRLATAFGARGLELDAHVRIERALPEPEFFALALQADLCLDTIGWSGGMTALDLLGLGLPTVTLPGDTMRSRQTAALLSQMGVDELIVNDEDEYVARVVDLARAPTRRAALRDRLRAASRAFHGDARVVAALGEFLDFVTLGPPTQ